MEPMAAEYGPGVTRTWGGRNWASLALDAGAFLVLLALVASLPAYVAWRTWTETEAMRAAWTVEGPPCAMTAAAPSPFQPIRTFRYGGTDFTRLSGAADCVTMPELGPWSRGTRRVCQFNNPGAVIVATGGQSVVFRPPPGRRVTVTVRDGVASCVIGGWFNL
jgi:hypothetical protein